GPPICALRASARRISGKDFGGWPTPQSFDATGGGKPRPLRYKGNAPSERGNTRNPNTMGSYRGDLKDYAALAGWPTPQEDNANNARGHKGTCYSDLPTTAQMVGWNTPRATDGTQGGPNQSGGALPLDAAKAISGPTQSGFLAKTEKPAGLVLNPHFSRWLMG